MCRSHAFQLHVWHAWWRTTSPLCTAWHHVRLNVEELEHDIRHDGKRAEQRHAEEEADCKVVPHDELHEPVFEGRTAIHEIRETQRCSPFENTCCKRRERDRERERADRREREREREREVREERERERVFQMAGILHQRIMTKDYTRILHP